MLLIIAAPGVAQNPPAMPQDLMSLPLDQLLNVEVYTPSKKEEKLSQTPAAISVITQDDIRRSGAQNIPEALRLAPGLDVAQVDSQQWAISARGFNDVFANKLLVLEDGRSLYTPLFSGVFWNVQDTFMPDIDRIEVIRGPGATLWGANAVNGVINVITKSAKDTQGLLLTGGGGSEDLGFAGARFGGTLGQDVYYRVYGQYLDTADFPSPYGGQADDTWQKGQAGFRIDWDKLEKAGNALTLQGDLYGFLAHQGFTTYSASSPPSYTRLVDQDDYRASGANILGRWTQNFSDTSDLRLQFYFEHTEQNTVIFQEGLDTYDLDLQHHLNLGRWSEFVWGAGYRLYSDHLGSSPTVSFSPSSQNNELFNAFVQDEVTLVPERLRLTFGTKLEHNDYTGLEIQPSGRIAWTPSPEQTLWGAVSHAVRTPSRTEEDVKLTQIYPPNALYPGSPVAAVNIYGDSDFNSEKLTAFEAGYRLSPWPRLSLDLTAYYNRYTSLRTEEVGNPPTQPVTAPPPPPNFVVPTYLGNGVHGDTYGLEFAPTWQVTDWWRLRPSYSLLKTQAYHNANSTDVISVGFYEGTSPQQQASLRSSMDLPLHLSLDGTLRYVDELPYVHVSSYVALDLRLAWRPKPNLEFAIVGQNLLSDHHAEFAPTFIGTQRAEVPESVYAQVTWNFSKSH